MTPKGPIDRRSLWRVGPESTWTTVVPVVFIIVSLLSLVVLPLVVAKKTARMRNEISRLAEPARVHANQIQVDLSSELDKIIAYQVTGQEQFRREYFDAVAREEANRRALEQVLPVLGEDLSSDLRLLFVQMTRWHDATRRGELLARQLPMEVFLARLFESHPAYEQSLHAASALELGLQTGIEDRLEQIRDAEQLNISLTIILTLLALTSAMLVAGLGRQMRLLAREAMRRRLEAERETNEAQRAREAAEREERRAAFLAAAGQEFAGSLDYEQTIGTVAKLIVPNLAELCVIDIAEEEGGLRRVAIAHRNPEEEPRLAAGIGSVRDEVPEALVRMMQQREPALVGATSGLYEYITGQSDGAGRTLIFLPLVTRGQSIGLAAAVSREGKPFTPDDLPLFAELARRASLSIDNARLYLESQQAVRAREEVLAIVSHDLRNPLNAIMLGASLLQTSENLGDEDREQLDAIVVSARRMRRLIADLLDVTRLEGGKRLPIEPAPVPIADVFREAQELFRAQASVATVAIDYEAPDAVVHADRDRIMQVLSNLIGNALKFTPPGGRISVCASHRDGEVLVSVRDTGPGIPHEHLGHIFSPYWQAKRAERLGAGLGLPIARGIVEAHGGRIWAESEPGSGTTFFFTLPLANADAGALTSAAESAAPGSR
ncbi:MAG: GAF domain-containing protein [Acidobacteria bacterium]|nr:GAF domain-containing protein [Acidobacteriota bacterium]MBV9475965.1 GAF domain-containing protein [Acidobacteriota bacterium]